MKSTGLRTQFRPLDGAMLAAPAAVFLMGVTVILGWFSGSTLLVQVHPSFAPMQFNTALLFIVSSIGILSLLGKKERLAFTTGFFVFVFSLVTGIQYPLGISLGLDELFMDSNTLVETSHPGRMAPNTALCFGLTGLCILIRIRRPDSSMFAVGGSLVLSLSVLAIFGYLTDNVSAYGWGNLTRMAIHTATGFLIFSLVMVGRAWRETVCRENSQAVPEWFPFFCGAMALTAGLCAWSVVSKLERAKAKAEEGWVAEAFRSVFVVKLSTETFAIERLARRWENGVRGEQWRKDAQRYLRNIEGLKAVVVMDGPKVEESVFHEESTGEEFYHDARLSELLRSMNREAKISRTLVGSVPVVFTGTERRGFLIAVSESGTAGGDGLVVAYLDITEFFRNSTKKLRDRYEYRLLDSDGSILAGPEFPESLLGGEQATSLGLNTRGQNWMVEAVSKGNWMNSRTGFNLSMLVLIAMVFFSLLVTALAALAQRIHRLRGQRSDEEIRLANEEMETMLFIIAHDLREPLRTVMSFSLLVESDYGDKLGSDGKDLLRRVVNGGRKIESILEGVTDVAKADKVERSREPIDLGKLVREELEVFERKIEELGAEVEVADDLPVLRIDETWVRQAIANLIGNALKFSATEAPRIRIRKYVGKEGTGLVVRDNGTGIPENMEQKVFDLFRRGVQAETPGSGLGLAIVKRVALRHGGKAWARNLDGGGAEFYVTFASPRP